MNDTTAAGVDSTEDNVMAVEGGQARTATHRFAVADERLNFRTLAIADPVPLGRQILEAAGYGPPEQFLLFAALPGGDFEDVRPDEPFDLRERGVEQFVAFRSDRAFRFILNGHTLFWGLSTIAGQALSALAQVPADQAVFLEVRGGTDRLIEPTEQVDLAGGGTEQFITAPRPPVQYQIIVNARPRTVTGELVTFEQVVELAFPGAGDPNAEFDVSYSKAATQPPAGQLGRGGSVKVKNGTILNVTRTVRS